MKRIFLTQFSMILFLALVAPSFAHAAETNHPPATTNSPAHKPTLEERRERMQSWHAEHGGGTNNFKTNLPPADRKLSVPERRARMKARLAASQQTSLESTNTITNKP